MALFESGDTITGDTVSHYLPANATVYTPAVSPSHNRSYDSERELIFNMIFRLQGQIEELKSRLDEAPRKLVKAYVGDSHPAPAAAEDDNEPTTVDVMPTALVNISDAPVIPTLNPGPRSLEEEERQAIEAALERNSGRRKIAARELGISERTLYRKIKEYGLD